MIENLTEEQKAKFPEYIKKWTDIGLCTDRINHEKAKEIATYYYEKVYKKPVPEIEICASPVACWDKVCELHGSKIPLIWPYIDGHFSVGYFSRYDFMERELGVNIDNEHWEWYKSTVEIGPLFTLDEKCFVSDRPKFVSIINNLLHCETGPAIEYEDGFCVYALNGVRVDKYLVMTPWNELDCKLMLKEKNAEVRREFVRKAGIEKVMVDLDAKILDARDDYELLALDLGDDRIRPYLKMKNPSIGVFHIEGVHPDCRTVDDALKFRNGTTEKPEILT